VGGPGKERIGGKAYMFFSPGTRVNWASVWILRNVTGRRGWANVAAASQGTKPYCGWSQGAMSIALMTKRAMWIPRIVCGRSASRPVRVTS